MSFLAVENVGKTFVSKTGRPVEALAGVSLAIERNEFCCVVGPSGGGKSTLLNIVAGFERPTRGIVAVAGTPVRGPSVSRVMVFQEFALFPWLTVRENVAFGLEMQGVEKAARQEIAGRYIKLVNLERFADSYPSELSGGMKQRVAIARALAVDPEMLLMDEPFGALDAHTRGLMQGELLRIWERERKTVLFVTHSVEEAVVLADTIVVIAGRPGTARAVLRVDMPRPRDERDARFIGLKAALKKIVLDCSTELAGGEPG
jgi:NitT/TauT family transport system ATP-binding protein